jgi:hypothetical protein
LIAKDIDASSPGLIKRVPRYLTVGTEEIYGKSYENSRCPRRDSNREPLRNKFLQHKPFYISIVALLESSENIEAIFFHLCSRNLSSKGSGGTVKTK